MNVNGAPGAILPVQRRRALRQVPSGTPRLSQGPQRALSGHLGQGERAASLCPWTVSKQSSVVYPVPVSSQSRLRKVNASQGLTVGTNTNPEPIYPQHGEKRDRGMVSAETWSRACGRGYARSMANHWTVSTMMWRWPFRASRWLETRFVDT